MHAIRGVLVALALIVMAAAAGCLTSPQGAGPSLSGTVKGTGTVVWIDIEGGFFGIISDDGTAYQPLNLDDTARVEGLRVQFEGIPRPDVITMQQWGTPIQLIRIEKI